MDTSKRFFQLHGVDPAGRPTMRFVPIKTVDQQAALMLAGERERLVRQRTQLTNTIRGYAAKFGLIAAKGAAQIKRQA